MINLREYPILVPHFRLCFSSLSFKPHPLPSCPMSDHYRCVEMQLCILVQSHLESPSESCKVPFWYFQTPPPPPYSLLRSGYLGRHVTLLYTSSLNRSRYISCSSSKGNWIKISQFPSVISLSFSWPILYWDGKKKLTIGYLHSWKSLKGFTSSKSNLKHNKENVSEV